MMPAPISLAALPIVKLTSRLKAPPGPVVTGWDAYAPPVPASGELPFQFPDVIHPGTPPIGMGFVAMADDTISAIVIINKRGNIALFIIYPP
jgi:hypothetical protein